MSARKGFKRFIRNITRPVRGFFKEQKSQLDSFFRGMAGQGTDFERTVFENQEDWAWRNFEQAERERAEDIAREREYRDDDIARAERMRAEDIERESLPAKMAEARAAGLHGTALLGGMGGGGGGGQSPMTRTQITGSGGRIPRPVQSGAVQDMSPVEMASVASQINNDKANQLLLAAETDKIRTETSLLGKDLESYDERFRQATNLNQSQINEIASRITSSNYNDIESQKRAKILTEELTRWQHDNGIILTSGMVSNLSPLGATFRDLQSITGLSQEDLNDTLMKFAEALEKILSTGAGLVGDAADVLEGVNKFRKHPALPWNWFK